MGKPTHIALAGKMGAGKSELARYLSREYGHVLLSTSHLCRMVSKLMFGDETRMHLNQVGDALRRIDENIWIRAVLHQSQNAQAVVLDSVRYTSEASFLRTRGFEIWRVTANEAARLKRLRDRSELSSAGEESQHASEMELDHFHYDFVSKSGGWSFQAVDARLRGAGSLSNRSAD